MLFSSAGAWRSNETALSRRRTWSLFFCYPQPLSARGAEQLCLEWGVSSAGPCVLGVSSIVFQELWEWSCGQAGNVIHCSSLL